VPALPREFAFDNNYPNPFNPTTNFSFALPVETAVNISIYNILGRKVAELVDGVLPAGRHTVSWDGKDSEKNSVSTGVYFAQMKAGEFKSTKKLSLIK
jgi:flagellar hook assembly protein FlgD